MEVFGEHFQMLSAYYQILKNSHLTFTYLTSLRESNCIINV